MMMSFEEAAIHVPLDLKWERQLGKFYKDCVKNSNGKEAEVCFGRCARVHSVTRHVVIDTPVSL